MQLPQFHMAKGISWKGPLNFTTQRIFLKKYCFKEKENLRALFCKIKQQMSYISNELVRLNPAIIL